MATTPNNSSMHMGTLGGIFATLIDAVDPADLLKTVVLSVTGTVISILMSLLVKKLLQRSRKPKQ